MTGLVSAGIAVPFLGLRYYDETQADLFFGRDDQINELLRVVDTTRFLTVIGSSGSGKSSLVRAGLIPALRAGLSSRSGRWRIVKTQPADAPIRLLASAMEQAFGISGLDITLRRGPLGLIEAAAQCGAGKEDNLLILVDQFEEVFRYRRDAGEGGEVQHEGAAFVKLLLEAASSSARSVCVVLTMRSEYLGNCAEYRDLPERINNGLYLIPRMTRDQLEEAIRGPIALFDASITGRLVQRLLNDIGDVMDQLPVLQHALLRTWLRWNAGARPGDPIDIEHYEAAGGLKQGLSRHADEIYDKLTDRQKRLAEVMFRCLTEKDPRNRDGRRPTELRTIAAIADASAAEIREVTVPFREEGTAFLMPPPTVALEDFRKIDITHESLIRQWTKLSGQPPDQKGWVQEEAELRDRYRELLQRAVRRRTDEDLLFGGDLDAALEWRKAAVGPAWAQRYDSDPDGFAKVDRYIADSEAHRVRMAQEERLAAASNRNKKLMSGLLILATLALVAVFAVWRQTEGLRRDAEKKGEQAEEARVNAEQSKILADEAKVTAEKDRAAAEKARGEALREKGIADALRSKAEVLGEMGTARQLASQANELREGYAKTELRTLLALESINRAPLDVGLKALGNPLRLLAKPKLVATLPGSEYAYVLAISSDGQQVASAVGETVTILSGADGAVKRKIKLPGTVEDVAWRDDQVIALSENAGKIEVFRIDSSSGRSDKVAGLPEALQRVLSEDGAFLVLRTRSDTPKVLDLNSMQELPHFSAGGRVTDISPGGNFAFRAAHLREGAELAGPAGKIASVHNGPCRFSRDGRLAACLAASNRVEIYEANGTKAGEYEVKPGSKLAAIDGSRLALQEPDGAIIVTDWKAKRLLAVWADPALAPLITFVFHKGGDSASFVESDLRLRVVNLKKDEAAAAISFPTVASGSSATFHTSNRWLVAGTAGRYALIDSVRKEPFQVAGAKALSVSPDGRFVAAIRNSRQVSIHEDTGKETRTIPLEEAISSSSSANLALSPGGRYAAVVQEKSMLIYDVQKHTPIDVPLAATSSGISRPSFSADGKYLVFVVRDKTASVIVIQCGSWKQVFRLELSTPFAVPQFSPNSQHLSIRSYGSDDDEESKAGSRPSIRLVTIPAGQQIWQVPARPSTAVPSSVFSPDGGLFAVPSLEGQVRIFDTGSGRELLPVLLEGTANRLAFSPSGMLFAAGDFSDAIVYRAPNWTVAGSVSAQEGQRIAALRFESENEILLAIKTGNQLNLRRTPFSIEYLRKDGCSAVLRNLSLQEWKRYLPDHPHYRPTCPGLPVPTDKQ